MRGSERAFQTHCAPPQAPAHRLRISPTQGRDSQRSYARMQIPRRPAKDSRRTTAPQISHSCKPPLPAAQKSPAASLPPPSQRDALAKIPRQKYRTAAPRATDIRPPQWLDQGPIQAGATRSRWPQSVTLRCLENQTRSAKTCCICGQRRRLDKNPFGGTLALPQWTRAFSPQ